MIFVDESAKNNHTTYRHFGWSVRGTRPIQRASFKWGKRYSLLLALTLDGIITYKIFEGSVTSDRFLEFLQDYLVRKLDLFVLFNCLIVY